MAPPPRKKHPTVGQQAVIDKVATALVSTWFAKGWIVQPQNPNYHEDYVIERTDNGELSGAKISAQQKGHSSVKFEDGVWTEQMATKHLRYYAEKLAMPVFLFVVCTKRSRGYFLFVQEWLDQNATAGKLAAQETMGVKVPIGNSLKDSAKFADAVRHALAYMAKRNPGTVEDAMQGDVRKLMAIDPRVDVRLDVVNDIKHYTLFPKENIAGVLRISGPAVATMKEHIDYGTPVKLNGDAIKIDGFPMFDHLIREKGSIQSVAITPAKPFKVEFSFWSEGANSFRLTLPGTISAGEVGLLFTSNLPGTPLRARMALPKAEASRQRGQGMFSVKFAFEEWENKPIVSLPYFDKLRGFANAIVAKSLIQHEVTFEGNRVTGGTLGNAHDSEPFEFAAAVIGSLAKARAILTKLGVSAVMPKWETLGVEDHEAVDTAYLILFGGSAPHKQVGVSLKITLPKQNHAPGDTIANLENLYKQKGFSMTVKGQKTKIYGAVISLGDVSYTVVPATLLVPEPGRSEFLAGRSETVSATIESLPESDVTIATFFPSEQTDSSGQPAIT